VLTCSWRVSSVHRDVAMAWCGTFADAVLARLPAVPAVPAEPPKVLHYGLLWSVPGTEYSFDKHWHYSFDPLTCPPWNIG
jgi:hypothetical protein